MPQLSNGLTSAASRSEMTRRFPGAALQPVTPPQVIQDGTLMPAPASPGTISNALTRGRSFPFPDAFPAAPPAAPSPSPSQSPPPQPSSQGGSSPSSPSSSADMQARAAQALKSVPTAGLVKLAAVEDHVIHSVGTMLTQRTIDRQDIADAIKQAGAAGHIGDDQAASMLASIPRGASSQTYRTILEQQMAGSVKAAVAIHAEAQSRGVDLASLTRSSGKAS